MANKKAIEKIAKFLRAQKHPDELDKWEELPKSTKELWFVEAHKFARLLKSLGYVQKAEDQSLPPIEIETEVNGAFDKFLKKNRWFAELIASMMGSTMISKSWVKVKKEEK